MADCGQAESEEASEEESHDPVVKVEMPRPSRSADDRPRRREVATLEHTHYRHKPDCSTTQFRGGGAGGADDLDHIQKIAKHARNMGPYIILAVCFSDVAAGQFVEFLEAEPVETHGDGTRVEKEHRLVFAGRQPFVEKVQVLHCISSGHGAHDVSLLVSSLLVCLVPLARRSEEVGGSSPSSPNPRIHVTIDRHSEKL